MIYIWLIDNKIEDINTLVAACTENFGFGWSPASEPTNIIADLRPLALKTGINF